MVVGTVHNLESHLSILSGPVWRNALTWLCDSAHAQEPGIYELRGQELYVSVDEFTSLPRKQALFESHRLYIDIHYCIQGEEIIEWAPIGVLTPRESYDSAKDYVLYEQPLRASSLLMTPKTFAVFFPDDAHMPKLALLKPKKIKKAVVKLRTDLLKLS